MRFAVRACSRRAFLRITSSTIATAVLTMSSGCGSRQSELEHVAERMVKMLNHNERARMLGSLYIDQAPGERKLDSDRWTEKILGVLKIDYESISKEELNSLEARVREQVRQDFVNEDVVIVKSYMFSNTEIMLCALAASRGKS